MLVIPGNSYFYAGTLLKALLGHARTGFSGENLHSGLGWLDLAIATLQRRRSLPEGTAVENVTVRVVS